MQPPRDEMDPDVSPEPTDSLRVGSRVYASDYRYLGSVSGVRGEYFKVGTPRWHRDYWLRRDCVGTARPGDIVFLTLDSDHINGAKVSGVPRPRD